MVSQSAGTSMDGQKPAASEQHVDKISSTPLPVERPQRVTASFSMAHALSMMRNRQEEEKRKKEEEEKRRIELSKEKEREKRRRRRQNQKLKKAKQKAEAEAKKPKLMPRVLLVKRKAPEKEVPNKTDS